MKIAAWVAGMCAVALSLTAPARAEQACVRLESGAEVGGKVLEHAPPDHLTLDAGDGSPTRYPMADIASYRVHPDEDSPCGDGPSELPAVEPNQQQRLALPGAPMTVAQFIAVQDLLDQRRDWRGRYTSLAIPYTLTPLSVATAMAGAVLFAKRDSHLVGNIVLVSSALMFSAGLLSIAWITSETQKEQQLRRIDERLQSFTSNLEISPWLTPQSASSELGAGVTTTVRF